MTTLTEQVRAEARALDPRRVLLTLLFALPFALGWLAGMTWTAFAWTWTAVVVGWRTARERDVKPAAEPVAAEAVKVW
jgi:hypothetical protein